MFKMCSNLQKFFDLPGLRRQEIFFADCSGHTGLHGSHNTHDLYVISKNSPLMYTLSERAQTQNEKNKQWGGQKRKCLHRKCEYSSGKNRVKHPS